MALSRRELFRRFGTGGAAVASAAYVIGYGREELLAFGRGAQAPREARSMASAMLRLSSNENLRGPSAKVLEVLKQHPSRNLGLG